ncbi:MAG: hypothetical protein AAFR94_01270 [Pseudomonadota bacterium]
MSILTPNPASDIAPVARGTDGAPWTPADDASRKRAQARAPLRIGVIAGRETLGASWARRLIGEIFKSEVLDLAVVIAPDAQQRPASDGLFGLWSTLENRLVGARFQDPDTDFEAALGSISVMRLEQFDTTADAGLDVIIDLTAGQTLAGLVGCARYGVWFMDAVAEDGDAFGLASILSGDPATDITLFSRQVGEDTVLPLARAALNPKFIAARQAAFLREKSVALVLRELRRLQNTGEMIPADPVVPSGRRRPTTGDLARYLTGLSGEVASRAAAKVRTRLRQRPGMFCLRTTDAGLLDFSPAAAKEHVPIGNTYAADPFLWDRDGEQYCFFETKSYDTGLGHIDVARFEAGELVDVQTALKTGYHLSFPFLFQQGEELFMIPESCAARRIDLWRCAEFPNRWEHQRTLIDDVVAADTSIAEIDGTWWMFTNMADDPFGEMNSELHLFRINGPDFKTIEPHPLNPVVFDTRTARNAGRILFHGGQAYRPSQDNSHGTYGYGLNLMRIDRIDMTDYAETRVRHITPDFEAGLIGCHHLDMRGSRIVFDVRRK